MKMTTQSHRVSGVWILIIVLILCLSHEGVYVECRHLKSTRCKKCSKLLVTLPAVHSSGRKAAVAGGVRQPFKSSKAEQPQEFRPTSPGHSPGVGHNIKN